MVLHRTTIFQNRKHAASLLGERLMEYENSGALVVAVSGGGIHVGFTLAKTLRLPLEAIPCLKLKHRADESKTIGAVSLKPSSITKTIITYPRIISTTRYSYFVMLSRASGRPISEEHSMRS